MSASLDAAAKRPAAGPPPLRPATDAPRVVRGPRAPWSDTAPGGSGQLQRSADHGLRLLLIATPLLALAASARAAGLRRLPLETYRRILRQAGCFDRRPAALGLGADTAGRARFAVLSTIDDVIDGLSRKRGVAADRTPSLLARQASDAPIAKGRFLEMLEDAVARPGAYADLVGLFHACTITNSLLMGLVTRMSRRLAQESDATRIGWILGFPGQMEALGDRLGRLLEGLSSAGGPGMIDGIDLTRGA